MEEVDKIIIHTLKDIGCNISDENSSLDSFSSSLIVEAAVRCLEIIAPGIDIPKVLPQNMAAKFQVGAAIALACKNLGYIGDVGYQTFMYSDVNDVRRVFMFLVEKLPRETEKNINGPSDPLSKLMADVSQVIKASLSRRLEIENVKSIPFITVPLEIAQKKEIPFLINQTTICHTLPSIAILNSKEILEQTDVKKSTSSLCPVTPKLRTYKSHNTWLNIQENVVFSCKMKMTPFPAPRNIPKIVEDEEMTKDVELKKDEEKVEIEYIKTRIDDLKTTVKMLHLSVMNATKECIETEVRLKEIAKEYEAHRMAIELLPKHEDNLKKLEEINGIAKQRLLTLATQWDGHRKPLIQKYLDLKMKCVCRATENDKEIEAVKDLKRKLDSLSHQIAIKQTIRTKLLEEYEQLPKNIKRSAYTRRILEIIGNIKKQNDEIDKILRDTKAIQKETNVLTERLDRLFTVVDESIFRNAKDSKDEISKKAYKHLATLQTDCADIVKMVKETGVIVREIRDLEEQVDLELSKNVVSNLQRISSDLLQMKSENKALLNQLNQ